MSVKIVINLDGGLVRDVYINDPSIDIECIVVDFDVEGVEEDKLKTDIDGYEYVSHSERLFFLDEYVDDIFAQHNSIED